jgi:hypothetical protein
MDRIEPESFGLFCPDAADVFIRLELKGPMAAAA